MFYYPYCDIRSSLDWCGFGKHNFTFVLHNLIQRVSKISSSVLKKVFTIQDKNKIFNIAYKTKSTAFLKVSFLLHTVKVTRAQ